MITKPHSNYEGPYIRCFGMLCGGPLISSLGPRKREDELGDPAVAAGFHPCWNGGFWFMDRRHETVESFNGTIKKELVQKRFLAYA